MGAAEAVDVCIHWATVKLPKASNQGCFEHWNHFGIHDSTVLQNLANILPGHIAVSELFGNFFEVTKRIEQPFKSSFARLRRNSHVAALKTFKSLTTWLDWLPSGGLSYNILQPSSIWSLHVVTRVRPCQWTSRIFNHTGSWTLTGSKGPDGSDMDQIWIRYDRMVTSNHSFNLICFLLSLVGLDHVVGTIISIYQ